ncbi:lamin tail domain-containing protein, partial [Myxococcota bacterium]|nr:lamin tail domain-containing protein [Myxococcota bacterium]
ATLNWYPDVDGDTYGDMTAVPVANCANPGGMVNDNTDCNDAVAAINPAATEICDGIDNNCTAGVDEGFNIGNVCGSSVGECSTGTLQCNALHTASECVGNVGPTAELCDGLDNNCDGAIDEDFPTLGASCGTSNVGACQYGTNICNTTQDGVECSGNIEPAAIDICNNIDDDCDGVVDAGICQANASCEDDSDSVDAYCACDSGYYEVPAGSGVCSEAIIPPVGSLVVNEAMIEPVNTSLADGQYFEVVNTTDSTLLMNGVGFHVWNSTTDDFIVTPTMPYVLLLPHSFYVVARNANTGSNGGVPTDLEFAAMPVLETGNGTVEVYRDSDSVTLDAVTWDGAWNHVTGHSIILSMAALGATADTLNDDGSHWCFSDQSLIGSGDYGTPGSANDLCEVNWCNTQYPDATTVEQYQYTDYIFSKVWEQWLTDDTDQGGFIISELGYGAQGSTPDGSWTWYPAVYNLSILNDDEYMSRIQPDATGIYDYAFRYSLDGGLSWKLCDLDGSDNGYDSLDAGELTVTPAIPNLFFSEYIEGSGNNKAVEIYNPMAAPYDLSQCEIKAYHNGNLVPNYTTTLSGTLNPGDVFVVCNTTADPAILAVCDFPWNGAMWSGNDVVELSCNSVVIDVLGEYGETYVWGEQETHVKDCMAVHGDPDGTDFYDPTVSWTIYPVNTFTELGSHTTCY